MNANRYRFGGIILGFIIFSPLIEWNTEANEQKAGYSREEIERALDLQWSSLSTISMTCEEFPADEAGVRKPNTTSIRYDYIMGDNHQRKLLSRTYPMNSNPKILEEIRNDGTNEYVMMYDNRDDQKLQYVHSKPQTNLRNDYQGSKFGVLWLMLPDGKPLIDHMKSGAEIASVNENNRVYPVIKFEGRKGTSIECKLDPEHDWLPSTVKLTYASRKLVYTVLEFGKSEGRYFPKRGIYDAPGNGQKKLRGFEVSLLAFNKIIPDSEFSRPPMSPGVSYNDQSGRIVMVEDPKKKIEKIKSSQQNLSNPRSEAEWVKSANETSSINYFINIIYTWKWLIVACGSTIIIATGVVIRNRR